MQACRLSKLYFQRPISILDFQARIELKIRATYIAVDANDRNQVRAARSSRA